MPYKNVYSTYYVQTIAMTSCNEATFGRISPSRTVSKATNGESIAINHKW